MKNKDLLLELVKTDFKLRYNNSVLGFIWVFLKPFLLFAILLVVFSKLAGHAVPHYPVYLLLGIIMFTFFSEGTTYGMNSLLNKSGIILKINFPRHIAVFAGTLLSAINYFFNVLMFTVISAFFGVTFSLFSIPYFIFISFILYLLIITFSLFASVLYVKYRDLSNIWELTLQLIFYATPIIYSISQLNSTLKDIIDLNPLTMLIQGARNDLIYGSVSYTTKYLILGGLGIILYFFAYKYFHYMVKKIAEYF